MGQWVVTVAGIAILSVLCDIILPEGQTRKYVKTVFGIVVTLVIVLPLVNFAGDNFIFESAIKESTLQEQYLNNVDDRQKKNSVQEITLILSANGVNVRDVSLTDDNVTVTLSGQPSVETEKRVCAVVEVFFPNFHVQTVWV